MKIAISSTGKTLEDNVDVKFGRCLYFVIVEIENKEIKEIKAIENIAIEQAGGAGITAAELVANQKVEAIISKNLGPRAHDVFGQLSIKVYQGEGKISEAVQQFIKGELIELSEPTGPQHRGMEKL